MGAMPSRQGDYRPKSSLYAEEILDISRDTRKSYRMAIMAEKVAKLGLKRDKDYLLYVKGTKVFATRRGKHKKPTKKYTIASFAPHKKSSEHVYFVDKQGDVSRAKRAKRSAKRRKK